MLFTTHTLQAYSNNQLSVERHGSGGRASDSRLREPGFESCAAVLKPWAGFFILH